MRSSAERTGNRLARLAASVLLAVLAACSCAQDRRPSMVKVQAARPDLGKSTLTKADLSTVVAKLEHAIRAVCGAPGKSRSTPAVSAAAPATREQVVLEFDRLFEIAKPHFKFTPQRTASVPHMITIKNGRPAHKKLERLIAWQCVAKVGPLAANLKPTMTLDEFGDSVGFFYSRIADLTHTPSAKFSPYISEHPQSAAGTGSAKPGAGSAKSNTPESKR